jgi:GLPGLI family protein
MSVKKIIGISFLIITGFSMMAFINLRSAADSNFEGIITYSTTSSNSLAAQTNGQQSTSTFYIKGGKMKTVIGGGTSFMTTTISDCSNPDDYIMLMDVHGSKYNVKIDKNVKVQDPVITYTDETKSVAGYTCHKAEVKISIDSIHSINEDVYYTTEISSSSCGRQYKGLKGFPLEWIAKFGANTRTTIAISIDKKSLSDDEFTVPPGYKPVTQEEMAQDIKNNTGNKGK